MKKRAVIVISIFLSSLLYTCSDENNPFVSDTPVVDPITNTWTVQSDSDYTFSFVTYDSLVVRGVFFGEENHPEEGFTELGGFFDGTYVEFDVRRPFGGRIKFKGGFINSNRMEIESTEGRLVLTR